MRKKLEIAPQIQQKVQSLDYWQRSSHSITSITYTMYESRRNEWNTDIEMRKEIVSQSHEKSPPARSEQKTIALNDTYTLFKAKVKEK